MCFDGTHEFTFRMTYRHTHNVLTIAYQRISPKKNGMASARKKQAKWATWPCCWATRRTCEKNAEVKPSMQLPGPSRPVLRRVLGAALPRPAMSLRGGRLARMVLQTRCSILVTKSEATAHGTSQDPRRPSMATTDQVCQLPRADTEAIAIAIGVADVQAVHTDEILNDVLRPYR